MIDIAQFGKIVRRYSGHGQLSQDNLKLPKCSFEVAQFTNGDIILIYSFSEIAVGIKDGQVNLQGITDEGKQLIVSGPAIRIRNSSLQTPYGYNMQLVFSFHGDARLKVGTSSWDGRAEIHFALTNFEFIGTDVENQPGRSILNTLSLNLAGTRVLVRQVPDYESRLDKLQDAGGVEVTSEARLTVEKVDEVSAASELVTDLCSLLTIARGTTISWLYFDVIDYSSGTLLYTEQRCAITRGYMGGLPLIGHKPSEITQNFVQSTFNRYRELGGDYNMRFVVNLYVDARHSGFLETKGLVAAALVDYLVNTFAKINNCETITNDNEFEGSKERLRKRVRQAIRDTFSQFQLNEDQVNDVAMTLNNADSTGLCWFT